MYCVKPRFTAKNAGSALFCPPFGGTIMDVENKNPVGSLRISNEVIATVAKLATLEVEGVAEVSAGNTAVKKLITKTSYVKPIKITLADDTASLEISIIVKNGNRIPDVALEIQKNVKSAVENMTSLKVDRVDVVVSGIADALPEEN